MIRNAATTTTALRFLADSSGFKAIFSFANGESSWHGGINGMYAECTSGAFENYAPRLYKYFGEGVQNVLDSDLTLEENFSGGACGAIAINFGSQRAARTDSGNLSFGWSCVTALGSFNPDQGGHLVF
jgi:hypothetical protein